MRFPKSPPSLASIQAKLDPKSLFEILTTIEVEDEYRHWDKLSHLTPPADLTHEQWWFLLKRQRRATQKDIPLRIRGTQYFHHNDTDLIGEHLHFIDKQAGGTIKSPSDIHGGQHRERFLTSSLLEEAIKSSQLEGASTTKRVAKEMIMSGRKPRDRSEKMILNNFQTMRRLNEWKDRELSPELVFEIHEMITRGTLDDPRAAGRFRNSSEDIRVTDEQGNVAHDPPPAEELESRMAEMCQFAMGETPHRFLHPAVRSVILHFWLAFDHPFVDGNGRTARALFYWSMLRQEYWLFEFISISSILRRGPARYARSFLYTESDGGDLTYFIAFQLDVIRRAIESLNEYLERKQSEIDKHRAEHRALNDLNPRQHALIVHALKHPDAAYTFSTHRNAHGVVYQTARTDLLELHERGFLTRKKRGRAFIFEPPHDLRDRLRSR